MEAANKAPFTEIFGTSSLSHTNEILLILEAVGLYTSLLRSFELHCAPARPPGQRKSHCGHHFQTPFASLYSHDICTWAVAVVEAMDKRRWPEHAARTYINSNLVQFSTWAPTMVFASFTRREKIWINKDVIQSISRMVLEPALTTGAQ